MPIPEAPLRAEEGPLERRTGFWEHHARAPTWPEVLLSVLLVAGLVVNASDVPPSNFLVLCLGVALCVVGGRWLLHLLVALARASEGRYGARPSSREWCAWLLLPVTFGAAVAAIGFDLPRRERFALSEPAFAAIEAGGADAAASAPSQIGLYDVREVRRENGRTWFVTRTRSSFADSDGWDEFGIVRRTDDRPGDPDLHLRRIRGHWYAYEVRRWE